MNFDGVFINLEDFEPTAKKLGGSLTGNVIVVTEKATKRECACKIFKSDLCASGVNQMSIVRQAFQLSNLKHPASVSLKGINMRSHKDPLSPIFITDLYKNGSLETILKAANKNFTPTKKHIALLGISHFLKYVHSNGITHNDLKPTNILFDDQFHPHVSDTGLSMTKNNLAYTAPEGSNSTSADVFAFGILAFEIITGKNAFTETGDALKKVIASGYRPSFTSDMTVPICELISKCWKKDSADRPSFSEIYEELQDFKKCIKGTADADEIEKYIKLLSEVKSVGRASPVPHPHGARNDSEDLTAVARRREPLARLNSSPSMKERDSQRSSINEHQDDDVRVFFCFLSSFLTFISFSSFVFYSSSSLLFHSSSFLLLFMKN
ncbi:hypothetical protein TRFO_32904 [Tritrichomonas foetus]|uniref:Protein kinase domain-containing protein n=1 Tax=Tritrichomonas foetus TaxID=1144522 RepID=A0A1J4JSD6_9EUKA|nr:hypothetical protein TRFO_32904 [Tritrichomonas foetus]|eukprot:OHT00444.1 hypothetical protein TRFO_32904 [Tritrichomonas foetus]